MPKNFFEQEDEQIEFYGVEAETDRAWLLDLGNDGKVWFPKSQCEIDLDGKIVYVPLWLAEEKGLA